MKRPVLGRVPRILDAASRDQEGMVQPIHSSGWRSNPEILILRSGRAIADLSELRKQYPKLDMPEAVIGSSLEPQRPKTVFLRSRLRRCRLT